MSSFVYVLQDCILFFVVLGHFNGYEQIQTAREEKEGKTESGNDAKQD